MCRKLPGYQDYHEIGAEIKEFKQVLKTLYHPIQKTYDQRVLNGVGGLGGLYDLSFEEFSKPTLVTNMDSLGSKPKVAAMLGEYKSLGYDVVYHCVNDILCLGAKPLFFMDYFGCSRLEGTIFKQVLEGAIEACQSVDCAFIGGHTAQLSDIYQDDEIALVGSVTGIVEREQILPRGEIKSGDVMVGLASNGLHASGYALARHVLFEVSGLSVRDKVPVLGTSIGEELMRPQRCYWKAVHPLLAQMPEIYSIAHITQGGFYGSLPRSLPSDMKAVIDARSWTPPPIFKLIQEIGKLSNEEMFHTFNMGIGLVLVVDRHCAPALIQMLAEAGEIAAVIGEVQKGPHEVQIA
jgi:phosphoribosylformylglycinamidine cyclo-ligase